MMVSNFCQSLFVLNQLNRNYMSMAKHMRNVMTGMRINSVADDPSGWAIGQRMSVSIRGLDQATRNAQMSQSMMKVADGSVSSTIDILKTLKEKAIAAANDTATDQDRAAIQKEFNEYIDQIDDNALVTYNGKYLMDGSHNGAAVQTTQAFTNQSLGESTTSATKLTDLTRRNGDSLNISTSDSVHISFVKDGKTYTSEFQVTATTTLEDIFIQANNAGAGTIFDTSGMDGSAKIGTDASGREISTPDGKNAITVKMATAGTSGAIGGFTIGIYDSTGKPKTSTNTALDDFTETIQPRNASDDRSLYTQTGIEANQGVKLQLGDLRSTALGLKGADGTVLNVSSREGANAAINVLDNALARALDASTTIGAVSSRMDYTIENLTTQSENLTAAMSTILDADMAREMLEYTKSNLLVQAAQAMLAQSNRNMSWFLGLLQ